MENLLLYSSKLSTHLKFNNAIRDKIKILQNILYKVSNVTEYNIYNVKQNKRNRIYFKILYELHTDKSIDETILYSIEFNGYADCIEGLINNIEDNKINFATFIHKSKKSYIQNNYYACLKNNNPVKIIYYLRKI